jgi:organic radical activating enzyme
MPAKPTKKTDGSPTGYLIEIFSSYQGEGGSVSGSCFGKRQIFVRFAGCNLASGAYHTEGCVWCDTHESHNLHPTSYRVEIAPSTHSFDEFSNPAEIEKTIEHIRKLTTPDLHTISFTGGEPCFQSKFLIALNTRCHELGYKTFLETNACIPWQPEFGEFDYYSCDIKDRTAGAALEWQELAMEELEFISHVMAWEKKVYAKVVVTEDTQLEDIEWIAQELGRLNRPGRLCPLVLQMVTGPDSPSESKMSAFMAIAAKYISPDNLSLSVQLHKYIEIL